MTTIKLILKTHEFNFMGDSETYYKFKTFLQTDMDDALFDSLDNNLSVASDDYCRLTEEFGGFGLLRGVYVEGSYMTPETVYAVADVLHSFGFNAVFDDRDFYNVDLPDCYWEE